MKLPQPTWARRLSSRSVVSLATVGFVGRLKPGPGTWGSIAGVLLFERCFSHFNAATNLAVSSILAGLAIAICGEAEIRLGKKDPGEIVLDEVVAIPLCFLGWRSLGAWPPWSVLLAGFLVFRLFDIFKPFGIKRSQDLPGGWGVVVDDTLAALATCGTLHLFAWGLHRFGFHG